MFLVPLLFILGTVSLYSFSINFFYTLCLISISIFIFENIKIHPYQYVWFNLPSRALDLTSKFEHLKALTEASILATFRAALEKLEKVKFLN